MASLSGMFNNFSNFLQNHQISFVNGLLVLFTFAGENIFRFTAFSCPCSQPQALWYGFSFMAGPFLVLTIIGIVVNNLTWRLCHGCRRRTKGTEYGCCESSKHFLAVLGRAFLVPSAWLFVAFLDGNYYTCMRSNAPCERDSEENKKLKAESQVISWVFLIFVVAISSIAICIARCSDSLTYLQNQYLNIYREEERRYFEEKIKLVATGMANTNVDMFADTSVSKKEEWDKISKASKHCIELGKKGGPFFTPLHEWSHKKRGSTNDQNLPPSNSENNYQLEDARV